MNKRNIQTFLMVSAAFFAMNTANASSAYAGTASSASTLAAAGRTQQQSNTLAAQAGERRRER
jgi:hypothetical protein